MDEPVRIDPAVEIGGRQGGVEDGQEAAGAAEDASVAGAGVGAATGAAEPVVVGVGGGEVAGAEAGVGRGAGGAAVADQAGARVAQLEDARGQPVGEVVVLEGLARALVADVKGRRRVVAAGGGVEGWVAGAGAEEGRAVGRVVGARGGDDVGPVGWEGDVVAAGVVGVDVLDIVPHVLAADADGVRVGGCLVALVSREEGRQGVGAGEAERVVLPSIHVAQESACDGPRVRNGIHQWGHAVDEGAGWRKLRASDPA